jgi:uncharacterized LabA/DUF88 family protein
VVVRAEKDFIYSPFDTLETASGGVIFLFVTLTEPALKRAIAFIDGQNLFYGAKDAFGYPFPNYDVVALSTKICQLKNWNLSAVRFYTGIPDATDDAFWNGFWMSKLGQMGRQKVAIYSRPLRYRNQTIKLPTGATHTMLVGQEKGIDVRIALNIVRLANQRNYDVALVFSQDQDLSEVADEIKLISKFQMRWMKMACAFPISPTRANKRGINGTEWVPIDRAFYDSSIDPRDYRPKVATP